MWCGVNYICGVACEFFWGLLSFCLASGLKFFRPFRAWPMGGHVRGLTRPGYYRAGPPGQLLRAPAPFGQVDSAFRLAVLGAPEAHCLAPAGSPGQLERGR